MLCWSEGGISKLAKKLGMRHTRMMDSFHESQCISKMSVEKNLGLPPPPKAISLFQFLKCKYFCTYYTIHISAIQSFLLQSLK